MSEHSLRLVSPEEQLRGLGPAAWERLVRTTRQESEAHRGVVATFEALARQAVVQCVAPSAQSELLEGLDVARRWVQASGSAKAARQARSLCFSAVPIIEDATAEAIERAGKHRVDQQAATDLDPHADHVVLRFARLGAHHAAAAVCHTLDSIDKPELGLEVASDAAGARAYHASCLGAARHASFRQAAIAQAEWEASRSNQESAARLSVQVFHEYLGSRWRAAADVFTVANNDFLSWALSGAP